MTSADAIVSALISPMENSILKASEIIPVSNAPNTYPKSLQNLNIPKLIARC